jgi:hypothetical protein
VVLILVLVALLVAALKTQPPHGEPQSPISSIALGLYIIAWGCMFLASYYFSHKAFFFRGLIWVCEHFSRPRSRKMAFFYFALATALGGASLISGLGAL